MLTRRASITGSGLESHHRLAVLSMIRDLFSKIGVTGAGPVGPALTPGKIRRCKDLPFDPVASESSASCRRLITLLSRAVVLPPQRGFCNEGA